MMEASLTDFGYRHDAGEESSNPMRVPTSPRSGSSRSGTKEHLQSSFVNLQNFTRITVLKL